MARVVRILHTDPKVPSKEMTFTDGELDILLHVDRINYTDPAGNWHSADVVRRIYEVSDSRLVLVVED